MAEASDISTNRSSLHEKLHDIQRGLDDIRTQTSTRKRRESERVAEYVKASRGKFFELQQKVAAEASEKRTGTQHLERFVRQSLNSVQKQLHHEMDEMYDKVAKAVEVVAQHLDAIERDVNQTFVSEEQQLGEIRRDMTEVANAAATMCKEEDAGARLALQQVTEPAYLQLRSVKEQAEDENAAVNALSEDVRQALLRLTGQTTRRESREAAIGKMLRNASIAAEKERQSRLRGHQALTNTLVELNEKLQNFAQQNMIM